MLVSTIINFVGIHIHSFSFFFSFLMKIRYQNRSPVFFICLPKWLGFSMCILRISHTENLYTIDTYLPLDL